MFKLESNRKIQVEIIPHCGVYATTIMRAQDCTESEKSHIMEKLYEMVERYHGETSDFQVFIPTEGGEEFFNKTFVFPNGELTKRYVEAISHI